MLAGKMTRLNTTRTLPGINSSQGFTYIGILISIAILGVALAKVGVIWHTVQQRERERELLFAGDQFRNAIRRYYTVGQVAGAAGEYPQTLQDLLRDPRQLVVARFIRKIYYDPMTGSRDWGLVKNSNGRIIGVYSTSHKRPIKQKNFSKADKEFEGSEEYSKWTFIYSPKNKQTTGYLQKKTGFSSTAFTQGQQ